jgi:preprotein translocase subunit SecG
LAQARVETALQTKERFMNYLIGFVTVVHVLVALFVIVLVLMQKSSEQGVGAAFGGGVTETVFGAGTTTALVRMTIYCACALLATTLILAVLHSHRGKGNSSLLQRSMATMPATPAPQSTFPLSPPPSAPGSSEAVPTTPATATQVPAAQPQSSPTPSEPAATPKTP